MKNGFCITYKGYINEIEMGWYTNDRLDGNSCILFPWDLAIKA